MTTLLNFSHPITDTQRLQITGLGATIAHYLDVRVSFDHTTPFATQVHDLVNSIGWSTERWQTEKLIINPPSFAPITATLLAELHGRCGYFPPILRLRPLPGTPPSFEIAEIIDLNTIRAHARESRT